MAESPYARLAAFDRESGHLNAVIETPQGSRNKYKYDEGHGVFTLDKVLPAGAAFPFDFGYIPQTLAADGDPVDVVVLMEEATFPGCLIPARLVGVIEAEQQQGAEKVRNDRLIAVPLKSQSYADVQSLDQLRDALLKDIEHFFVSYHQLEGTAFTPIGRAGPDRARALVEQGIAEASRHQGRG